MKGHEKITCQQNLVVVSLLSGEHDFARVKIEEQAAAEIPLAAFLLAVMIISPPLKMSQGKRT